MKLWHVIGGAIVAAIITLFQVSAHADEFIPVGTTSRCLDMFVADSSSTTGAGLPGLAFNTASLTCYYHRSNAASVTQISLVTMTLGTFTSSGFVVVDGTNMPGWYQLCVPDAAFASGANYVSIQCKGATNMAQTNIRAILTANPPDVNIAKWNGTTVTGTGPTSSGRPGQR